MYLLLYNVISTFIIDSDRKSVIALFIFTYGKLPPSPPDVMPLPSPPYLSDPFRTPPTPSLSTQAPSPPPPHTLLPDQIFSSTTPGRCEYLASTVPTHISLDIEHMVSPQQTIQNFVPGFDLFKYSDLILLLKTSPGTQWYAVLTSMNMITMPVIWWHIKWDLKVYMPSS